MPLTKENDGTYSYYNRNSDNWTTINNGIKIVWNYKNNTLKGYMKYGNNWDEFYNQNIIFTTENKLKTYTQNYVVPESSRSDGEYSDGGRKPRRRPPPTHTSSQIAS